MSKGTWFIFGILAGAILADITNPASRAAAWLTEQPAVDAHPWELDPPADECWKRLDKPAEGRVMQSGDAVIAAVAIAAAAASRPKPLSMPCTWVAQSGGNKPAFLKCVNADLRK